MKRSPNAIVSRSAAALIGGYILANAAAFVLAAVLPMAKIDATLMAMQLSYLIYAMVILWVFSAETAVKAWVGVVSSTLCCLLFWAVVRFL